MTFAELAYNFYATEYQSQIGAPMPPYTELNQYALRCWGAVANGIYEKFKDEAIKEQGDVPEYALGAMIADLKRQLIYSKTDARVEYLQRLHREACSEAIKLQSEVSRMRYEIEGLKTDLRTARSQRKSNEELRAEVAKERKITARYCKEVKSLEVQLKVLNSRLLTTERRDTPSNIEEERLREIQFKRNVMHGRNPPHKALYQYDKDWS